MAQTRMSAEDDLEVLRHLENRRPAVTLPVVSRSSEVNKPKDEIKKVKDSHNVSTNKSGILVVQQLDPQKNMEKLQQLCEKQHEQINTIIAAQGAQLKELQHQIAELQEHRKANQQPLREVTDTLAQLTGKIVGIWEMSKGVVVKDSQGMGEPLETPDSPGLDGSPAGAIAVLDASKASITVGPQTRTTALNAAPNVSITVSSPRSTTATVLKPRDSAVSSIKASTSAAVAALSTSSTTTADPNPKIHAKHAFVAASNDTGFDRTWGTETSLISGEPKAKVLAKIAQPRSKRKREEAEEHDGNEKYRKAAKVSWLFRGDGGSMHDESDG